MFWLISLSLVCAMPLVKGLMLWLETMAQARRTGRKSAGVHSSKSPASHEATKRLSQSLAGYWCWDWILVRFLKKTSYSNPRRLVFCKANVCLVYQFQNVLHSGLPVLKRELLGSQMEGSEFLRNVAVRCGMDVGWISKRNVKPLAGKVAQVVFYTLDPLLCHGTWTKLQCFGLKHPTVYVTPTWEELGLLKL